MSIVTKNRDKFSFLNEQGLEVIAPKDVKVYVHVEVCMHFNTNRICMRIITQVHLSITVHV